MTTYRGSLPRFGPGGVYLAAAMPISRRDLVDDLIAAHPELTRKAADRFVADLISTIAAGLKRGESVRFAGFGSFHVRATAARVARVPGTDRTVQVPAGRTVRFRSAKALKASLAKPVKPPKPAKKTG